MNTLRPVTVRDLESLIAELERYTAPVSQSGFMKAFLEWVVINWPNYDQSTTNDIPNYASFIRTEFNTDKKSDICEHGKCTYTYTDELISFYEKHCLDYIKGYVSENKLRLPKKDLKSLLRSAGSSGWKGTSLTQLIFDGGGSEDEDIEELISTISGKFLSGYGCYPYLVITNGEFFEEIIYPDCIFSEWKLDDFKNLLN